MNKKEEIKSKKKIAAVDVMIAILLILCVAGIVIRVAVGDSGIFASGKGEYIVSYVVRGEDDEYSPYFAEGREFFLESGEKFGTLIADAELPPAEIYEENPNGDLELYYAQDGTVDFKGTLLVKGTMTDSGFLLNSNTYIAPNMTVTVSSSDITVELLITDITKAQ
ncbi:MAG: DUF4330 family protein [Ruminococcaceae bacterium]|nr:DUF4330 family protein [Oscillospiraceae bacterium]